MGWKAGEGWSYGWPSDYSVTAYQVIIDEKVVIDIKNQNRLREGFQVSDF